MAKQWTAEEILSLGRGYQRAAVLAAAADLELFGAIGHKPLPAAPLARRLRCDRRALTILLDALAAMQLLEKRGERYSVPASVVPLLGGNGERSVLAMTQHQANCMRRWGQLARVAKTGKPAPRSASIRGEKGDAASFIGAMHDISGPQADRVIRAIKPLNFRHLLDVGGASGTWTIAFLRACPEATATLFDLPQVIPMARRRLNPARLGRRVKLVAGDYTRNALPPGADFAWISAIVHQHSREQNRRLFQKVNRSLLRGGRIAIRDILMDSTHTKPASGALFAINMLVATHSGAVFTFEELREDLISAGFKQPVIARHDEWMNSIVIATKP